MKGNFSKVARHLTLDIFIAGFFPPQARYITRSLAIIVIIHANGRLFYE